MLDVGYIYGMMEQNNWYGFGMNGSTLVYNSTIGTQHSFQVGGVQKAYINSNGLAVNGDIYKYSSTAPPNANCIGYTSQVNISQLTNLALNASASYLTITLPYAGTYECSASVCLQYSCDYIYICII